MKEKLLIALKNLPILKSNKRETTDIVDAETQIRSLRKVIEEKTNRIHELETHLDDMWKKGGPMSHHDEGKYVWGDKSKEQMEHERLCHAQLGRQQTCPACGGLNPSGFKLPQDCIFCGKNQHILREGFESGPVVASKYNYNGDSGYDNPDPSDKICPKSTRIYLASPYTHDDPDVMGTRYELALHATSTIANAGYIIYSPIVYTHIMATQYNLQPENSDWWVKFDQSFLENWATLFMLLKLPGWDVSTGIAQELTLAEKNKIKKTEIRLEHLNDISRTGTLRLA